MNYSTGRKHSLLLIFVFELNFDRRPFEIKRSSQTIL